jgi:hypothetical protein
MHVYIMRSSARQTAGLEAMVTLRTLAEWRADVEDRRAVPADDARAAAGEVQPAQVTGPDGEFGEIQQVSNLLSDILGDVSLTPAEQSLMIEALFVHDASEPSSPGPARAGPDRGRGLRPSVGEWPLASASHRRVWI